MEKLKDVLDVGLSAIEIAKNNGVKIGHSPTYWRVSSISIR